ncbi:MAG TPA: hypothetical protein VG756_19650 [Pseudonocardiaceae bacterium]|nr:hypothetical protein [Pseudonocardiaceae bacterium]
MTGPRAGEPDSGGDPVCWLNRVCPDCGLFVEQRAAVRCPRCGAELPAESVES